MDKFKEYKLNIWEKEKKLIREYLEKIQEYITQNSIDSELYNDIEEMIFEKLSLEIDFDQLKIKKILKEVWEPEVIFSDYVENKKINPKKQNTSQSQNIFYEQLIAHHWERDNEGAILLWVSQVISKKTGVPVWGIRILFILFVFVFWLSIWFYILIWLILPVKWVVYDGLSLWGYLQRQIYLEVKDLIYNIHHTLISFIKLTFKMLGFSIKFAAKNIFPIVRFIFFGVVSFCFASVLFWFLVVGAFYFSGFSIWNMEFFSVLPPYFLWGILFGVISVSIFTVWAFLYAVKKQILNGYIFAWAGVCFLIALFLWISTGFNLTEKYFWKTELSQETSLDMSAMTSESIVFDTSNILIENMFWPIGRISSIRVETATGNIMTAQIIRKIYGNESISNALKSQFNDLVLTQEENKIILWTQNNKIFKNKVPFSIFESELILTVPQNKKYFIEGNYAYFINVHLAEKYGNYQNYIYSDCRLREIYYSQEEWKFVCDASEYELNEAKLQLLENDLIKNFEKISPLLHQDEYKREYYNNYDIRSDWNFENIYLLDETTLATTFWDMSLQIDAQVNFENTASWIIFSNFEIKDVDVDYMFHPKYYKDISSIQKFIPQEKYEKFLKE